VIASAAEPEQLVDLAHQLVQKAMAGGMFIFADADLKFDQPPTGHTFRGADDMDFDAAVCE